MKGTNALRVLVTALVAPVASIIPYEIAQNRLLRVTELDVWFTAMDLGNSNPNGSLAVDLQNLCQSLDPMVKEDFRSYFNSCAMVSAYSACFVGGRAKKWIREETKRTELGAEKGIPISEIKRILEKRLCNYISIS